MIILRTSVIWFCVFSIIMLPGCKLLQAFGVKPQTEIVDTWCLTAKKRQWALDDRPEAIREARIHNQLVDRRCGSKDVS